MKKTYIIAEIGNTHEGSLGLAKKFIKEASLCGVDAVKMQTHIFEAESLLDAPNPAYFILIGDAMTDYNASVQNNIIFYGFNNIELKKFGNYIDNFMTVNFS